MSESRNKNENENQTPTNNINEAHLEELLKPRDPTPSSGANDPAEGKDHTQDKEAAGRGEKGKEKEEFATELLFNYNLVAQKLTKHQSKITEHLASYGEVGLNSYELSDLLSEILFITNLKTAIREGDQASNKSNTNIKNAFELLSNYIKKELYKTEEISETKKIITYPIIKSSILEFVRTSNKVIWLEREDPEESNAEVNPDPDPDPFLINMDKSIIDYEELAQKMNSEGKNTHPILHLLATLKKQKLSYLEENSGLNTPHGEVGSLGAAYKRTKFKKMMVLNPAHMTLEERRDKAIKEIFYFYAKQQYMVGNKPTFDQIEGTINTIYIGSFLKFCKDFSIPLKLSKQRELFKKVAHLSKDMKITDFKMGLQKIAEEIHKDKREGLKCQIDCLELPFEEEKSPPPKEVKEEAAKPKSPEKTEIKSPNSPVESPKGGGKGKKGQQKKGKKETIINIETAENTKQEKDEKSEIGEDPKDSSRTVNSKKGGKGGKRPLKRGNTKGNGTNRTKSPPKQEIVEEIKEEEEPIVEELVPEPTPEPEEPSKPSELELQIEGLKTEMGQMDERTDKEKLIELYGILECDDIQKYRKKIKGFTLPFHIKEETYRIPREDSSRKYQFKSDKTADEIKKDVQFLKNRRLLEKRQTENKNREKYEKSRLILRRIYERQQKEREKVLGGTLEIASGQQTKREVQARKERKYCNIMAGKLSPYNQKITLQSLDTLTYTDINQITKDDVFRPEDFLNDSDDEDYGILRKFKKGGESLHSPKKENVLKHKGKNDFVGKKDISIKSPLLQESSKYGIAVEKAYSKKKIVNKHIMVKPLAPTYKQGPKEELHSPEYGSFGEGYGMYPTSQQYGNALIGFQNPQVGGQAHGQHHHHLNHGHGHSKSIDYTPGYYPSQEGPGTINMMNIYPGHPRAFQRRNHSHIGGVIKKADISFEIMDRAKEVDMMQRKKNDLKYNKILNMQDRNQQRGIKSMPLRK